MDWHSDIPLEGAAEPDAACRPSRVTYNIPLVDFNWANGAMELLPGTHHLPRSYLAQSIFDVENLYPVCLRMNRGDALLRDGNGLHRGTPNLTDEPRPMLDQTYKKS
jgi:ectoine hydroxylase-related dioxygenase (phytanoyl-CoA dioxygenase family)